MSKAKSLADNVELKPGGPKVGVFCASDPRIDEASRERCKNIVKMVANRIAGAKNIDVVFSPVLVDGEKQADTVAEQFKQEGVNILVCTPDTWAFPQLSVISLLAHFPADVPINFTCGNSGPRPGVVFSHAINGALAQYGKMSHLNVGSWPDTGQEPEMSEETAESLINWVHAAAATVSLKGRRVIMFGHDSMGMETALPHVMPVRNNFGIEFTRLDMKLLADMVTKEAYDKEELKELRAWVDKHLGDRLEIRDEDDSRRFNDSLGMYLIVRDLMEDLNAVGGAFMSQLEWGSDRRGIPLPVADTMESLFNSTFDHNGPKEVVPFATEADMQGVLTMLFQSALTDGNPPLFMDFRKVWEPWEIKELAEEQGAYDPKAPWAQKGLVDGCNSGSAAFDWAATPGSDVDTIMNQVSMPLADPGYFPGGGNSVTFCSPGDIDGIAARLGYSHLSGMFSMTWDEATTVKPPDSVVKALGDATTPTWPHTFMIPKYAGMVEYKQLAPANHFHMVYGLPPARLEYWMDLNNVLSATPWSERPGYVPDVDRSTPLMYTQNGDADSTKMMLAKR